MKKRFLVMAAAAVLALGLTACGSSSGSNATTAKDAAATEISSEAKAAPATSSEAAPELSEAAGSDWYMQVLTDQTYKKDYPYYRFVDLNGDGVPLLFLSTTQKSFIGDGDKACLIAYVDGQPKVIKEIGGAGGESFYCDPQNHTLSFFSRLSGEGHLEVYTLKDGELVQVTSLDRYGPMHDPKTGDNKDTVYLQDGKDIKEDVFEEAWNKYADEKFIITYDEKNTF